MSRTMDIDGACLCGHVRYQATIDPAKVAICHCTQCQVHSASAYRIGVLVDRANFRLTSGTPKTYVKTAESGNPRAMVFCPECGTSIYGSTVTDQQTFSLRLGTARQRAELVPRSEMWCRSELPWLPRLGNTRRFAMQRGGPVLDDGRANEPLPVFRDARDWVGPQLASSSAWLEPLDAADVAEIDAAVAAATAAGLDLVSMRADQFPLPRLAPRLQAMRREILHGRGFVLLRGWPSTERTLTQNATAFRGVGAHLGEALSQNGKGHVLGHVANLGLDYADPSTRGYQTSAELNFHTDGGDIVGLLCVRPSRSGGLSRIASSTAVWNEIVRGRPDLARALTRPYAFSRWGEIGEGQKPWFEMPLFQPWGGRMVAFLVPSAIAKAQKLPGAPALPADQAEALRMVGELAGDPSIRLDMDFRPGDMQFLSNHSVLHSRTAYEDWPEPERRRHLLRLWLASTDGPALPDSYTTKFQGRTDTGRPDGIRVPGVPLNAPLVPV